MTDRHDHSEDKTQNQPSDGSTFPDVSLPSSASVERSGRGSAPRRIGRYRIVRKLGEGGLGVVYEAEQSEPQRAVALKVIRGGAAVTDEVIKLFAREAQALARLRHPGIAAIYESGHTEDGQHFFAMELVRGKTLDEFLKARPDPAASQAELALRLKIFRKVCDAIAYAHQRGVIHRDLKPTNVMVTSAASASADSSATHDAVPEVKVLDFGLARITDADVAATSVVSEAGRIQGTLAYMSPEQARGNPDEIDVRSDVYSLGILFYEMLSGARPYEAQRAALYEAVRVICEQPARSFTESTGRRSRIDRDLETIALKALEKEPSRRYQSVSGFAEDIGRYLTDQPIQARPPSAAYQLRKMVRRHKLAFGFVVTTLGGIALLAAVASWQNVRISRALAETERERARGDAVVRYLQDVFSRSAVLRPQDDPLTVREVTASGARRIFDLEVEDEMLRADLMQVLGSVFARLGERDEARPLIDKSLELRRDELGDEHPKVAEARFWQAWLLDDEGNSEEARAILDDACPVLEAVYGERSERAMECLNSQAVVLFKQGRYAEALPLFERVRSISAELPGREDALAMATANIGACHLDQGELETARARFEEAIEIGERASGEVSIAALRARNNLGEVLRKQGRNGEAEEHYRQVLQVRRGVRGDAHVDLVPPLNNLAEIRRTTGRAAEAEELYREAQAIVEGAVGPDHELVGTLLFNRAQIQLELDEPAAAELMLRRSLEITIATAGEDHPYTAETRGKLAEALRDQGRLAQAEPLYEQAVASLEGHRADHELLPDLLDSFAGLREQQGHDGDALALRERAEAIRTAREL